MIPSGETLYTARTAYPDILVRGRDNALSMPLYRDGALVAPASGTVSIYKPGGDALVSAASVTIAGSIATYTLAAATVPTTLTPLGEGWREVWTLTVGGVARQYERTAALALISLSPVVTDADLLAIYPTLSRQRGSTLASFQGFIDEAWKRIVQRLIRSGHLPYLIRTPDALRECHIELSLSMTLAAFGLSPDAEHYRTLADKHATAYDAAWNSANWQLDYDQNGQVDDPTQRSRGGQVIHMIGTGQRRIAPGWA